jgi:hypothetical protein
MAQLQKIDPVWNWRRYPVFGSGKQQLGMWLKYGVEIFPDFGQPSGILDQSGNDQPFSTAFRKARHHQPKGIIQIGGTP